MKFSAEKKNSIKMYILKKIDQKTEGLSKYVSQELGISPNTVHSYLTELQNNQIILKSKRDKYELVTKSYEYRLTRSSGDLDHDTYAYDTYLRPLIKHLPDNIEQIWSYGMSEMVNNVIDHSQAETLTVIIRQNYLFTQVILIDNGIGIFQKIKDHFSLPNLDEAICELIKGKLTTDSENHSGEGIFFTSKMMDSFFILSDEKIFATTKYENDQVLDFPEPVGGTCVFMSLSNFTNRTAAEIFDLYSNDDGVFFKTRIPIKNIFDKAPISRSQAKRICNRLDQFKEVIVDFSETEWMGQGFAHQLFVVYAKAHPQTTIIPVNMNQNVENMYKHVMGSV
ncbi:MAG: DUF4325 domain-containing protein [Clostridia bacterium]|nr:DUF4325 domain-containing protein [Clostridia bacterium]